MSVYHSLSTRRPRVVWWRTMSIIRRSRRNSNFTIIYNEAIDISAEVSFEAEGVLHLLLSKPDDWTINKKHLMNLKRDFGDTKARRVFQELETAGFLRRVRTRRDDGTFGHETIVYETPFAWESEETPGHTACGSSTSGSTTGGSSTCGSPHPLVRTDVTKDGDEPRTEVTNSAPTLFEDPDPSGKQGEEDTVDKTDYTDGFSEAYDSYPRKIGRKAAEKAWKARIREGVSPEVLLTGVKNYALQCKKDGTEKRFIKHPSTFFGPDEWWKEYQETPSMAGNRRHNVMERDEDETNSGEVSVEEALGL